MRKTFGAILIGLGLLSIIISSLNARNAANPSYLSGTFLPGLVFLIFGLALRREKTPQATERSAGDAHKPKEVFMIVPMVRLISEDVQKFFDSFKLSAEPGAAPARGGS